MNSPWPGKPLGFDKKLSELTESHERAFLLELASEPTEDEEGQEEPKESPEEVSSGQEYNGLDPLTWTQFLPDGTEKHFRKDFDSPVEDSSEGFATDIEQDTLGNNNYREVIHTTARLQLVLMSITDEIGTETHPETDQFIRVESGTGEAIIDGAKHELKDGSAIIIPAGSEHNVVNNSKEPLKLYTIYSPPHHPEDTTQKTRPEE
jgi:mannose-6-phosphate isomerase-like protein (cupin superfamily)